MALLDIDHTLVFGLVGEENEEAEMRLNYGLLEALKMNGIIDVYFFSDMLFSAHSPKERTLLLQLLQSPRFGFRVHGVITPADVTWHLIPLAEAGVLETALSDPGYAGKFFGPEFQALVMSKASELPGCAKACTTYCPLENAPGRGFAEALNDSSTQASFLRSRVAKMLADHLADKFGYSHTKGLMLDLFLCHCPEWVDKNRVFVCDDNDKVIETVRSFHRALRKAEEASPPPITAVLVPKDGFKQPSSYYSAHFKANSQATGTAT